MATKVQHIVRWAVQDWRTCGVRTRSAMTGDLILRVVYFEILIALYESGGILSADPEVLADIIAIPAEEISKRLPSLFKIGQQGRGGLCTDGSVIWNQRVSEEIDSEHAFREQQAEFGRRGGQIAGKGRPKGGPEDGKGSVRGTPNRGQVSPNPPSPAPTPTPSPTPTPAPLPPPRAGAREEHDSGQAEPEAGAALPPDAPVASAGGQTGAPLPGEEQLEGLAQELYEAHPAGARSAGTPVPVQRALLDLLTAGRIWPDSDPPRPPPPRGFGMSFGELRARHAEWCKAWRPVGDVAPMNLAVTWLGRGKNGEGGMNFLQDPPASRNGNRDGPRKAAEWNPGSKPDEVERLKREIFG